MHRSSSSSTLCMRICRRHHIRIRALNYHNGSANGNSFASRFSLHTDQARVVTSSHHGHLCIHGRSGSGKSICAAERVLWLHSKRRCVLMLTAQSMEQSVVRQYIDQHTNFHELERSGHGIFQLHDWCHQTLEEIGIQKFIASSNKVMAMLLHHVHELPWQQIHLQGSTMTWSIKKKVKDLVHLFAILEAQGVTPQAYTDYSAKQTTDAEIHQELAACYQVYRDLMEHKGISSWHGTILDTLEQLRGPEKANSTTAHVRESLLHGFTDVVVDDLQGMTPAMVQLIVQLITSPSIQASMSFNINKIGEDMSDQSSFLQKLLGRKNYHVASETLDQSLRHASPTVPQLAEQVLRSDNVYSLPMNDTDRMECLKFDSMVEEERGIVAYIASLLQSKSIQPHDIAVVCPTYSDVRRMVAALSEQRLAVQSHKAHGTHVHLFDTPGVHTAFSLLAALSSPNDSKHLYHVLSSRSIDFPSALLAQLMEQAQKSHRSLYKTLVHAAAGRSFESLEAKDVDCINKFLTLFHTLQAESQKRSVLEVVHLFLEKNNQLAQLLEPSTPEHEATSIALADFLRELETAQRVVKSPLAAFVVPYLLRLRETRLSTSTTTSSLSESNGVSVLPLHRRQIQAMEPRILILASMCDSKFPGRMKRLTLPLPMELFAFQPPVQNRQQHLRQCEQLIADAILRAKDRIVASYFTKNNHHKAESISSCLAPIWIEPSTTPRPSDDTLSPPPARSESNEKPVYRSDYELNHLSFTQIAEYQRCPHRYYLSRVEKMPSEPSAAMHYGRALHEAIAAFATTLQVSPSTLSTDELIAHAHQVFQQHWRSEGFLSRQQELHLLAQGLRALDAFIHAHGTKEPLRNEDRFRPSMHNPKILHVECPFEIHVPEAQVALHGVWDRIDQLQDGRVIIREFKSNLQATPKKNIAQLAAQSLQLKLYMYAYRQVFGIAPFGAELVYVGDHDHSAGEGFIPFTEAACDEALEAIIGTANAIRAAQFAPTPSFFECALCPFASSALCPATSTRT